MSDVMDYFARGHALGQAEIAHHQALEENKIRSMVLKHQLDGLKIEDQIRARELAKQNLDLLHGTPAADLPTDVSTNLPSTSHAGVMSGLPDMVSNLVHGRLGADLSDDSNAVAQDPSMPTGMPAPNVQNPVPEQTRTIRPVVIPGVPGLGVPGLSVRPRSAEDLVRASVAAKLADPYTLNEGDTRYVGGQPIASGKPKPLTVARGSTVYPEGPNSTPIHGEPPAPSRPTVVNGRVLDAQGNVTATYPPLPRQTAPTTTGPTPAQRAAAERWKQKELTALEKRFRDTQPSGTDTDGQPIKAIVNGQEVEPVTSADLAREKQRIQDSYLEQIGAGKPKEGAGMMQRIDRTKGFAPYSGMQQQIDHAKGVAPYPVPPDIAATLKGQAAGKRYTMTDGTVWDILADGSIVQGPTTH